jgi:hypothetical protein
MATAGLTLDIPGSIIFRLKTFTLFIVYLSYRLSHRGNFLNG